MDVEHKAMMSLGKEKLTEIVKYFCERLEAKGCFVGIYSSKTYFDTKMHDDKLQAYAHWVAQWAKECTYKGDENVLGMWQFGGDTNKLRSNQIAGVVCDQNFAYVDFPAAIKSKWLNGYGNTTTAQKPVSAAQNSSQPVYKVCDKVKLKPGATYYDGKTIPAWVFRQTLYIRSKEFNGGTYNVSLLRIGGITGRVHKKFLTKA
jgi:hypothetical protein